MTRKGAYKAELVAEDGSVLRVSIASRDPRRHIPTDVVRKVRAARLRAETRDSIRSENRDIRDALGVNVR